MSEALCRLPRWRHWSKMLSTRAQSASWAARGTRNTPTAPSLSPPASFISLSHSHISRSSLFCFFSCASPRIRIFCTRSRVCVCVCVSCVCVMCARVCLFVSCVCVMCARACVFVSCVRVCVMCACLCHVFV